MWEFLDFLMERKRVVIPILLAAVALSPALYFAEQRESERYVEEEGRVVAVYMEEGIGLEAIASMEDEVVRKSVYLSPEEDEGVRKEEAMDGDGSGGDTDRIGHKSWAHIQNPDNLLCKQHLCRSERIGVSNAEG